jgi:flagellar FliJ protein
MSSSPLHAFEIAVEMAERQRDAARKTMLDARAALAAAQAQLEHLQGYAGETQGRWGMRAGASVQPEVMRHHYQFMDKLEHAIDLQTQVVSGQDGRVNVAMQALLQAELRLTSLRKALESRRRALLQRQERREQKETDEQAGQRFGRAGVLYEEP